MLRTINLTTLSDTQLDSLHDQVINAHLNLELADYTDQYMEIQLEIQNRVDLAIMKEEDARRLEAEEHAYWTEVMEQEYHNSITEFVDNPADDDLPF